MINSTFTIELPEALTRQIQSKGISQQQIETVLIRVVQLYLRQYQLSETEHDIPSIDQVNVTDATATFLRNEPLPTN
jgi:hypothetical protein